MGLLSERIQWLLDEVDRLTLPMPPTDWYFSCWKPISTRITATSLLDVPKHVIASRLFQT